MKKIEEIVSFVAAHPETVASRRICREVFGEALDKFNLECAYELSVRLENGEQTRVDSYYSMVK